MLTSMTQWPGQWHWPQGLEKHETYVQELLPFFMVSQTNDDDEDDFTDTEHPQLPSPSRRGPRSGGSPMAKSTHRRTGSGAGAGAGGSRDGQSGAHPYPRSPSQTQSHAHSQGPTTLMTSTSTPLTSTSTTSTSPSPLRSSPPSQTSSSSPDAHTPPPPRSPKQQRALTNSIKTAFLSLAYGTLLGPIGHLIRWSYYCGVHLVAFNPPWSWTWPSPSPSQWWTRPDTIVQSLTATSGTLLSLLHAGLMGSLFWIALHTSVSLVFRFWADPRRRRRSPLPLGYYNAVILLAALGSAPLGVVWRALLILRGVPLGSHVVDGPWVWGGCTLSDLVTLRTGCFRFLSATTSTATQIPSTSSPHCSLYQDVVNALTNSLVGLIFLSFVVYFGPAFVIGFRDARSAVGVGVGASSGSEGEGGGVETEIEQQPAVATVPGPLAVPVIQIIPSTPSTRGHGSSDPGEMDSCPHCLSPIRTRAGPVRAGLGRFESVEEVELSLLSGRGEELEDVEEETEEESDYDDRQRRNGRRWVPPPPPLRLQVPTRSAGGHARLSPPLRQFPAGSYLPRSAADGRLGQGSRLGQGLGQRRTRELRRGTPSCSHSWLSGSTLVDDD
ncbi:hypothetical protein AX16_002196 [Volvariella volvacea WC 439]|nr:hypothetical protein AX16_002196 [Volvariella volvacea WC 439]